MLARILLNRWALSALNLLILWPLALTIVELWRLLWGEGWTGGATPIRLAEDLVEGLGVVLIGWGVALEERHGIVGLLGGERDPTDAYELAIDHICHNYGLALLIFGLFAEIAMECVKLPDHIINTNAIERFPLSIATLLLLAGLLSLVAQIVSLLRLSAKGVHHSS